jgi:hypothetical protein
MQNLPGFKSFDPNAALRIYRRNLPHWRQRGSTYLVTFRQADSIPANVLRKWAGERDTWYRANGLTDDLIPVPR